MGAEYAEIARGTDLYTVYERVVHPRAQSATMPVLVLEILEILDDG